MRIVTVAVIACATMVGATTSFAQSFDAQSFHPPVSISADVRTPAGGFTLHAPALLSSLATLPRAEVSSYLQHNRGLVDRTLTGPRIARQVVGWWSSLARQERTVLTETAPEMLGNLDGIPLDVRDALNSATLKSRLRSVKAEVVAAGPTASGSLRSEYAGLQSVRDALLPGRGEPKRSLLSFDVRGTMRAAIAIGSVATADNVSVLVPGMFYSVRDQMVDWTATAQTVYDAQRSWLSRLGQSDRSVATVAWLGYRTPDFGSVLKLDDARAGADSLEDVLAGVRAVRGEHQPFLSVLAHSYGSTAAFLALQDGDTPVDALAVVGSPGSEARSVKDLDVRSGNVYVGAALLDPVAASGFFGVNPSTARYGAHSLSLSGGIDPIDGSVMLPAVGHNSYFSPGTESLRNLALIAIGDGSLATTPRAH